MLTKVLEQGKLTGEVRPDLNIKEVTQVILATCDGLILDYVTGRPQLSREEVKRAVWNTFGLIILPPGQAQPYML